MLYITSKYICELLRFTQLNIIQYECPALILWLNLEKTKQPYTMRRLCCSHNEHTLPIKMYQEGRLN